VLVVGFDLDMTLIDSRPGIEATLRALAAEIGVFIDAAVVVNRLGPTLEMEMANWVEAEQVTAASDRYRELYVDHGVRGTALLPGAQEAVGAVRAAGGRSIVVTAKFEPNAKACLEHVGLEVDEVIGWRYGPQKGETLAEHGASIYVGDTPSDIEGARAAGALAVCVPSGPHDADELRAAGADVVLASLTEFPAWFVHYTA
jgi:phosphoglycolate phosphatase